MEPLNQQPHSYNPTHSFSSVSDLAPSTGNHAYFQSPWAPSKSIFIL